MKSEVADILQQMQGLLGRLAAALQEPGDEAPDTPASRMPAAVGAAVAVEAEARADRVYYAPSATYRVCDGVTLAVDGEKPHWITINATGATMLRRLHRRKHGGRAHHAAVAALRRAVRHCAR